MSRFLRFAVEESLAGRAGGLKEYSIGIEVFDRRVSYDPRVDPIVRVEARRLRAKLQTYYEQEGRREPVRIDFPKGSYVPRVMRADAAPPVTKERVIVVAPFANLDPDSRNDYFCGGLTEEVLHSLIRTEGIRVAASRQFNTAWVLEGSVRRERDHLRVTAQLIDNATGLYVWSNTYDGETDGRIAEQERIAREIVRAIISPASLNSAA
jgi:TolB-like protein